LALAIVSHVAILVAFTKIMFESENLQKDKQNMTPIPDLRSKFYLVTGAIIVFCQLTILGIGVQTMFQLKN
jgi:hypothetical protein